MVVDIFRLYKSPLDKELCMKTLVNIEFLKLKNFTKWKFMVKNIIQIFKPNLFEICWPPSLLTLVV